MPSHLPALKFKSKSSSNKLTAEQQVVIINEEIMQKLTLMRREVVNLQDEVEGLRVVLEERDKDAASQAKLVGLLEQEVNRVNQRESAVYHRWDILKNKLQKLSQINKMISGLIESNYAA